MRTRAWASSLQLKLFEEVAEAQLVDAPTFIIDYPKTADAALFDLDKLY